VRGFVAPGGGTIRPLSLGKRSYRLSPNRSSRYDQERAHHNQAKIFP
jgi:hypothetical protein